MSSHPKTRSEFSESLSIGFSASVHDGGFASSSVETNASVPGEAMGFIILSTTSCCSGTNFSGEGEKTTVEGQESLTNAETTNSGTNFSEEGEKTTVEGQESESLTNAGGSVKA